MKTVPSAKDASIQATSASATSADEARVKLVWVRGQQFDVGREGRPTMRLDGHGKAGPSPFDGLLGSLAACSSVDVVEILTKRRTPPRSLEVEVVATRAKGVPRRLVRAVLSFRITGPGIDRANAERAIELAVTKYCSVGGSLDPAIPVEWTLDLQP